MLVQQEYNKQIAFHYNAFRPELHRLILSKCLGNKHFGQGLDIGCGTGQSAIALANFCERVTAIEPNDSMLAKAIAHPKITYLGYDGVNFPVKQGEVDIITFAGVLYYAKSQALLNEIKRVSKSGTTVIVYDFELLTEDISRKLCPDTAYSQKSDYRHDVDLTGLEIKEFRLLNKNCESEILDLEPYQLAHVLLADSAQYNQLKNGLGKHKLYIKLCNKLTDLSSNGRLKVLAKLYYTQYTFLGG